MLHVVILGGGFGGLYAARALEKADVRITVIDRRNHHVFQPLLYQVATAALNPADIARPIRRILRKQRNVRVILSEAKEIDTANKQVKTSDGDVGYDVLIVSTGATHAYFGNDEWAANAPGLKTIEDALEMRRRILLAYEEAEKEPDLKLRSELMTFVIVGGGPTGVELAGALAEIARHALPRDFREIDPRQSRIVLIEGLDRLLPTFPPILSAKAESQLSKLGVEVLTDSKVTRIDDSGVEIGDRRIRAGTVLWAAGVAASPIAKSLAVPLDKAGRVLVKPDLTIPGDENVFVIGDLAALDSLPGIAPVAMQQARHVGQTIASGQREAFRYRDRGMLATVGRRAAVASFRRVKLSGFVAWVAWLLIHIYFLIGFRNRLIVMFEWAWAYFTYERGARLITR